MCAKRSAVSRFRFSGVRRSILRSVTVAAFGFILFQQSVSEADAARTFPPKAQRGEITAHRYPFYQIDKKTKRLAVGGKIYNQHNMIVMPVSVTAQKLQVMYLLDMRGDLAAIWLLTPAEAAKYKLPKPKPQPAPKQAGNS